MIINNPQLGPYYLNDGVTDFTPLPYTAGQTWQARATVPLVIRSHKEFLIALGTIVISTQAKDANVIAWSAPATTTGIPFTWDPADLSTIAGELYLSGQGGYVIDGLTLRDEFCIYSKNAIDFMRYVGGELLWAVRPLSCETGLLALNGVAEVYDRHVLLTKNDILLNDGNSLTSIVDGTVRRRIFDALNTSTYERSFLSVNEVDKEVWICIPERGSTYANLAVVYAWESDKVYLRDTVLDCVDACTGPKSSSMVTWAGVTTTWENSVKNWNTDKNSTFESTFILLNSTTGVYDALVNDQDVSTGLNTVLERLNVSLAGYDVSCTTVSIHPHITCPNSVLIRMGASLNPNAGIHWKQAQIFNPSTMRKLDIRTTGPFHSWRIESIGNTPFSLSGMDIVYETNGER
jgi:hypothetical protein